MSERLDEGLECKLTIVSAPAGFGKTTLLSEWARRRQNVAWVSLDQWDNDPVYFWTYLIGALQILQPNIGAKSLDALYSTQPLPIEQALAPLINELAVMGAEIALVLDDYHVIHLDAIHASLSFFIERMPVKVHLYIVSRVEPPLRTTRLRANGDLLELRSDEIRFTHEESIAFLSSAPGLEHARDEIPTLATQSEGWIVGLQLIAMSCREQKTVFTRKEAKSGKYCYLTDYIVAEVLDRQPDAVRAFLLQTSILEKFNGPICDAVTGIANSGMLIEELADAELFLIPLDSSCEWYRYHHLFADVMRHRLREESPALISELHRRASKWYQQNGHPREAVSHMLQCGDIEQAALLAERYAEVVLAEGALETLLAWQNALPEEQILARPPLSLAISWALLLTGQLDAAENYLELCRRALQLRPATGLADVTSHMEIMAEFLASARQENSDGGKPSSDRALNESSGLHLGENGAISVVPLIPLPPKKVLNDGMSHSNGFHYHANGNGSVKPAVKRLDYTGQFGVLDALPQLARLQTRMGRLRTARESYYKTVQQWVEGDQGSYQPRNLAASYVGLGMIDFEWNNLDSAMGNVTEGLHLGKPTGDPNVILEGYLLLTQLHQSRGDVDGALDAFSEAERLLHLNHAPTAILDSLATHRVHLLLAQDNLEAAAAWASSCCIESNDPADELGRFKLLTLARVLIAQNNPDDALDVIARVLQVAEEKGWIDAIIQCLVLQTLAYDAMDDIEQATPGLMRALFLGESERYTRTFIREGVSLTRALRRVREELSERDTRVEEVSARYVDTLLRLLGTAITVEEGMPVRNGNGVHNGSSVKESLFHLNPLSEREIEVLRLIGEGKSNAAIAQSLYVSVSTVKTHINNLYSKLGVESRTQALSRGRELELL